jgi:hypothetical protein
VSFQLQLEFAVQQEICLAIEDVANLHIAKYHFFQNSHFVVLLCLKQCEIFTVAVQKLAGEVITKDDFFLLKLSVAMNVVDS